jgi:hypothetical protein
MEQRSIAVQRAMAAEIRSRLGYMNRSQAWLQDKAEVPSATWRKYFTEGAIERDVPLAAVERIARVLDMTTGELVTLAEQEAPRFFAEDLAGATPAEKEDLRRAIDRARPRRNLKSQKETETGT